MDLCLQKESKWDNTDKEVMGPCNRDERRICAKKEEGVSVVEGRDKRDMWVHQRTIKKRVYQTPKVTSNSICVFYKKEGW